MILHPHRRKLNSDALLALQIHTIQQLRLHLALLHRPRHLHHPISQRRLAVIDVSDDAKIADSFHQRRFPSKRTNKNLFTCLMIGSTSGNLSIRDIRP